MLRGFLRYVRWRVNLPTAAAEEALDQGLSLPIYISEQSIEKPQFVHLLLQANDCSSELHL